MVFDIWLTLGRRADTELHREEAVLLIKGPSGHVLLVRMKFEATGRQGLRFQKEGSTDASNRAPASIVMSDFGVQ